MITTILMSRVLFILHTFKLQLLVLPHSNSKIVVFFLQLLWPGAGAYVITCLWCFIGVLMILWLYQKFCSLIPLLKLFPSPFTGYGLVFNPFFTSWHYHVFWSSIEPNLFINWKQPTACTPFNNIVKNTM